MGSIDIITPYFIRQIVSVTKLLSLPLTVEIKPKRDQSSKDNNTLTIIHESNLSGGAQNQQESTRYL
jgi:hypothetical protein